MFSYRVLTFQVPLRDPVHNFAMFLRCIVEWGCYCAVQLLVSCQRLLILLPLNLPLNATWNFLKIWNYGKNFNCKPTL